MKDLIDLKGASGAVYRFAHFRDGRSLSPTGGAYLYVRAVGETCQVIHLGEGPNLLKDAHSHWAQAVELFGATDLFTRLNVTEWARQLEHTDMMAAIDAPMVSPTADGHPGRSFRPAEPWAREVAAQVTTHFAASMVAAGTWRNR
ncbi:MAG TPA: hypothetical protein VII73_05595 [Caulobacteraceae bacterium]